MRRPRYSEEEVEDIARGMLGDEGARQPKREPPRATSGIERAQQARADKVLDKRMTFEDRSMTRRQWLEELLVKGKVKIYRERQYDAEEKLEEKLRRMAAHVPFGNPNHPETKEYNDLRAKLKDGLYKERIGIEMPNGNWYELNKTELDYFNRLGGK